MGCAPPARRTPKIGAEGWCGAIGRYEADEAGRLGHEPHQAMIGSHLDIVPGGPEVMGIPHRGDADIVGERLIDGEGHG